MIADALTADSQSHSDGTSTGSDTAPLAAWDERVLWALVALTLCADVLSTVYGIRQGLTEGNPIVRTALSDGGVAAFGVVKLAIVNLAITVWLVVPWPRRVVVPLGLSVGWGLAVLVNVLTFLA